MTETRWKKVAQAAGVLTYQAKGIMANYYRGVPGGEIASRLWLSPKMVDKVITAFLAAEGTADDVDLNWSGVRTGDARLLRAEALLREGKSLREAGKVIGMSPSGISRALSRAGIKVSELRKEAPVTGVSLATCLSIYRKRAAGATWPELERETGLSSYKLKQSYGRGRDAVNGTAA